MIWDKPRILQELRRLHRDGADLSYSHLARQQQALLSAAAYHFGSYRIAIEKAGIDYAEVIQPTSMDQTAHHSAAERGKKESMRVALVLRDQSRR